VVLTGGAGFLGRSHAAALSDAGAHVVVADIDGKGAEEVAQSLPGAEGMAVEVDVSSRWSVEEMTRRAALRFRRIDGLVNNAAVDPKFDCEGGRAHGTPFENYPLEAWRRSLDVNLTGAFLCTQALAPFLLASGRASVVNVASIYGLVGPDQRLYQRDGEAPAYKPVDYSVTKSAMVGFTRYLASYWAGKGVRVNTLTLGGVEAGHDSEFVRRYSERTPLGRMAQRNEYSAALVFLLSDASSYMTGGNLVLDGGWTAW
jgi:NAD(P)-dependent dehydrogenase (short-subunit alcohol dehydrogenase family)